MNRVIKSATPPFEFWFGPFNKGDLLRGVQFISLDTGVNLPVSLGIGSGSGTPDLFGPEFPLPTSLSDMVSDVFVWHRFTIQKRYVYVQVAAGSVVTCTVVVSVVPAGSYSSNIPTSAPGT